jgi:hypothetical protein
MAIYSLRVITKPFVLTIVSSINTILGNYYKLINSLVSMDWLEDYNKYAVDNRFS